MLESVRVRGRLKASRFVVVLGFAPGGPTPPTRSILRRAHYISCLYSMLCTSAVVQAHGLLLASIAALVLFVHVGYRLGTRLSRRQTEQRIAQRCKLDWTWSGLRGFAKSTSLPPDALCASATWRRSKAGASFSVVRLSPRCTQLPLYVPPSLKAALSGVETHCTHMDNMHPSSRILIVADTPCPGCAPSLAGQNVWHRMAHAFSAYLALKVLACSSARDPRACADAEPSRADLVFQGEWQVPHGAPRALALDKSNYSSAATVRRQWVEGLGWASGVSEGGHIFSSVSELLQSGNERLCTYNRLVVLSRFATANCSLWSAFHGAVDALWELAFDDAGLTCDGVATSDSSVVMGFVRHAQRQLGVSLPLPSPQRPDVCLFQRSPSIPNPLEHATSKRDTREQKLGYKSSHPHEILPRVIRNAPELLTALRTIESIGQVRGVYFDPRTPLRTHMRQVETCGVVVALHGAALVNVAWMGGGRARPAGRGVVVELLARAWSANRGLEIPTYYRHWSALVGHEYRRRWLQLPSRGLQLPLDDGSQWAWADAREDVVRACSSECAGFAAAGGVLVRPDAIRVAIEST